MGRVTVIIPTTYADTLYKAVTSVAKQSYHGGCRSLIVVDGPDWPSPRTSFPNADLLKLPWNTGGNGHYGHRIYAGIPHLINTDYVAFLDQDNWYEPEHIETLVTHILRYDLLFAHSFRKIYDKNGNYLIDDNCESLGRWPVWPVLGVPSGRYHPAFGHLADTSSYVFRTDFLKKVAHLWNSGWGGDRNFLHHMISNKDINTRWSTTRKHTLCYRLDGNPKSVTKEFFEEGNQKYLDFHNGELPWKEWPLNE